MKVIKTRVSKKSPIQTVAGVDDFSDIKDYPVSEDRNSEQFTSIEYTPETFLPILENAKLPDEVLVALVERYDLRPTNNGVAVGVIGRWLSENVESFMEEHLDYLINVYNVYKVTDFVMENLINHSWIRSGLLKSNFIIPLIGESNHVKTRN